jgi:hypothetical protein
MLLTVIAAGGGASLLLLVILVRRRGRSTVQTVSPTWLQEHRQSLATPADR